MVRDRRKTLAQPSIIYSRSPNQVRVASLSSLRRFEISERDPGPVPPGMIRVRTSAVGICGSDLHYFSEGGIGDVACVYPMVLGHEPTGIVEESGHGFFKGDRVTLEPAMFCYHCEFCLRGRHNVCSNLRFLSTPTDPGFFRDYVDLPPHNALGLAPSLSLAEGTLVEPLAVVLHSMEFMAFQPGETAVVLGCGPIGLLTIAMLKLNGARRIWATDPLPNRRAMALAMGADVVLPPGLDSVQSILKDTGGRGVDVVADCAAKDGTINHALHLACSRGRVVITGIPSEARIDLEFHVMRRKELFLYNVRRSNSDSHHALRLLEQYPTKFGGIITHQRPFDTIQSTFEMAEKYDDGAGKVVLTM
jgi:L-iditol 2-dehydrogenase